MKFAKQLKHESVTEWRVKYFDYKGSKKRIKTVSRTHSQASNIHETSKSPQDEIELEVREQVRLHAPAMTESSSSQSSTTNTSPLHELDIKTISIVGSFEGTVENPQFVKSRNDAFYEFLLSEFNKVEDFYTMKEDQAGKRLAILRGQLREMRNCCPEEMADQRAHNDHAPSEGFSQSSNSRARALIELIKARAFTKRNISFLSSGAALQDEEGANSECRPELHSVSCRTAKRKLQLALRELYHGLELLKSYARLNRIAFHKFHKKYTKMVNTESQFYHISDKVSRASFANSSVIETYLQTIRDLYALHFEDGDRKLASSKLRSPHKRSGHPGSLIRVGLSVGIGAAFAIQGLVYGRQLLHHEDEKTRLQTRFLLQIYGGCFLLLYLFSSFCVNCALWDQNKVNYSFVFEADQRHHMDWNEFIDFPGFIFLAFGLSLWLNFSSYRSLSFFIYYPALLIFCTVALLFFPAPTMLYRTRKCFLYSHWRLFLAGFYTVQFRDLILGDIYCSLTYSIANVELFFCFYTNHWKATSHCDSSHSRLMGFLIALPPIWRFFQCLRRYRDTHRAFPHLANGIKYITAISTAVMLSLYRMYNSKSYLAFYISLSIINAIYSSIWDIFMDFSLLQPGSKNRGLRDNLALPHQWTYYLIILVDVIFRFAWIFYIFYTHDNENSTVLSFMVAFIEATRRSVWLFFRVENEHCANVSHLKAWREVSLPFSVNNIRVEQQIQREPDDNSVGSSHGQIGIIAV